MSLADILTHDETAPQGLEEAEGLQGLACRDAVGGEVRIGDRESPEAPRPIRAYHQQPGAHVATPGQQLSQSGDRPVEPPSSSGSGRTLT